MHIIIRVVQMVFSEIRPTSSMCYDRIAAETSLENPGNRVFSSSRYFKHILFLSNSHSKHQNVSSNGGDKSENAVISMDFDDIRAVLVDILCGNCPPSHEK